MELRRWLWIPLILQTLVWSLFFVFTFFGFAETFANAPRDWWRDHGTTYWILVASGLACLPGYHLVAWSATRVDTLARNRLASADHLAPLWRDSLALAGGMMVWGLWLAILVTVFGHLDVPPPWPDAGGTLLTFTPVELSLWACACGLATLTVLGLFDQMKPRNAMVGVRTLLLHLVCYVWFYATFDTMADNPARNAWLLILLAVLTAVPLARLVASEHHHPEPLQEPESKA